MRVTAMLVLVVGGVLIAPPAVAVADTTPPSAPQQLRISGEFRGEAILRWDASTDDSGVIYHYWVLVDGQQRARPAATTYNIDTLVQLCRITAGSHVITVQAVDPSLNRSLPSNPVGVVVGSGIGS
ncbi:fibronectin type III domain-containing protein [Kribbella sp. NPDC026611]|uniref:fibronectin type III domain-containing protein n=1 Tax=Kribbella sp. NPDC026611 TaxID=3154911 RepID=UPI0033FA704A